MKEENSLNKKSSNFKNSTIFEISAEFYPIFMYHMSKSDKNCENFELGEYFEGQNGERRTRSRTSWTAWASRATRAMAEVGVEEMGEAGLKKFRSIKSCLISKIPQYLKSASNSTPFSCIICPNRTKIDRVVKILSWESKSKAKRTNCARRRSHGRRPARGALAAELG